MTSACWPKPACSNCTRLLGHEPTRYYMRTDQFEQCVKVAAPFIAHSAPDIGMKVNRDNLNNRNTGIRSRKKVLGIFGGEPLMHPQFPDLVDIMIKYVPQANRGLWTSFDWVNGESKTWGKYRNQVERLLGPKPDSNVLRFEGSGYINWNMHEEHQKCEHAPVLAAAQDLIPDEKQRWDVIEKCWVQSEWSAAYALDYNNQPKFYFCEIASSFDRVFNLGTGLNVEEGVWSHALWFERDEQGVLRPKGLYANQILKTCNRCGASLKLPGRRDLELVDDVSPMNLVQLTKLNSPMVKKGQVNVVDPGIYAEASRSYSSDRPWDYFKDNRAVNLSNFAKAGIPNWMKPKPTNGE